MKYVLVSGGVISGVGKGIIASSTGLLLKAMGLRVTMIKIDPYMNIDAGTMSPTEHGEVFVLEDGGEVDLDLGNYERYIGISLTKEHSITTGKVYMHVVERERRGDYLGKTVQIIPHLTDAIQDWIERAARIPVDGSNQEPDICVVELGGTIGDIENAPFVEAFRQLRRKAGKGNFLHTHVSLVPVINSEQKTKPTQQAIRTVRSTGLNPDLIACRCKDKLEAATIRKIAMFCQVDPEQVIAVHDVPSTYTVPLVLEEQGLINVMSELLHFDPQKLSPVQIQKGASTWDAWKAITAPRDDSEKAVVIALVGKYTSFLDSYMSLVKALQHSAMACRRKLKLVLVEASDLEEASSGSNSPDHDKAWETVKSADGILVPGGFGSRGTEGMIEAAKWARENKVPYLGICLGMQIAVIEFSRNVLGLDKANSTELDPKTPHPVVINMPELDHQNMGGTMRLGLRSTHFQQGTEWSTLRSLYSNTGTGNVPAQNGNGGDPANLVHERHRHRYEINPEYVADLDAKGLHFIGKSEGGDRMGMMELKDHPFFAGVQFHPEYISKVLNPSLPIMGFLAKSAACYDDIWRME